MSKATKKFEWEHLLALYLFQLLEVENELEIIRKKLAKIVEFEPIAVFNSLDRTNRNIISLYDLKQFLKRNCITYKDESINLMIINHSSNKESLSFDDFIKIILTKTDLALRDTVLCRKRLKGAHLDYLDFKIEDSLAELFKLEIEITIKAKVYVEEITSCRFFDIYKAFSCIDLYKTGNIEEKGLFLFLSQNGLSPIKEELNILLKRLDNDNDNKVNFDDFKALFDITNLAISNRLIDSFSNKEINRNNYFSNNRQINERTFDNKEKNTSPTMIKSMYNSSISGNLKNNIISDNDQLRYTTISYNTQGNEELLSPSSTISNFKLTGMTNFSSFRLSRKDNNPSVNTIRPEHNEKPLKVYMQTSHNYGNHNNSLKENEYTGNLISSINYKSTKLSVISLDQLNNNIINSSRKNLFLQAKSNSYTYVSPKRLDFSNTFNRFNSSKNDPSDGGKQVSVKETSDKSDFNSSNNKNLDNNNNNALQTKDNISQIKSNLSSCQAETIPSCGDEDLINFFTKFIKDILQMYNKLEKIREVVNIDTNIYLDDLYKYFDRNGDMSINIKEFKEKLDTLNVKVNYEEMKLIFRRYDLEQNLSISYDEFCKMFYSKNPDYKNLICQKKSSEDDDEKNFEYIRKSFILKKFFKILIDCENNFEERRKKLVSHPQFSLYEVWDAIKSPGSNKITKEDMKLFLKKNNIDSNEYEIEILWDVFDKDCEGSISFKEFIEEIYPKNNLNFKV